MARTISILLTLVIGISLVALVYGQDRQPRETGDANTSTSSRDDSFPLPADGTVSVLEEDSDEGSSAGSGDAFDDASAASDGQDADGSPGSQPPGPGSNADGSSDSEGLSI